MLLRLEEGGKVTEYLLERAKSVSALINLMNNGQPAYIIEDACMDILTADLKPSKYNYICNVLEEEFESKYQLHIDTNLLKFKIIYLGG